MSIFPLEISGFVTETQHMKMSVSAAEQKSPDLAFSHRNLKLETGCCFLNQAASVIYCEVHWPLLSWSDFQEGFRGAFAAPLVTTSVVTVDSEVANKGAMNTIHVP